MKHSIILKITLVCMLVVSNFASAQVMRTEEEIVQYLDTAQHLDLIEGIYQEKWEHGDSWKAIVYNKNIDAFDCYYINPKSRVLFPWCERRYETHLKRTTKYAYAYYAYVIINGYRYEGKVLTFDKDRTGRHWRIPCNGGIDQHLNIDLKWKIYPKY